MIQAKVLASIVEYVQDKVGQEPILTVCTETDDKTLIVGLSFTIGRDYPGMKPEAVTSP
jgi:hypothetical protein